MTKPHVKHCPSNECQIRDACTRANPEMCLLQFSLEKRIEDAFSWQNDLIPSAELLSLGGAITTYFVEALMICAMQRDDARSDNEVLRAACRAMKADLDAMTKERDEWLKAAGDNATAGLRAMAATSKNAALKRAAMDLTREVARWQAVVEQWHRHDYVGLFEGLEFRGRDPEGVLRAYVDLFRAINDAVEGNDAGR